LRAACKWLQVLSGSVQAAHRAYPVSAADRDLLLAIPVNAPLPRPILDGSEPVTALYGAVITSAERARNAAWVTGSQPAWSPNLTADSLRYVAATSTVTSHHCEILLRSLAARTTDSGTAGLSASLFRAADAAGRARGGWLQLARAEYAVRVALRELGRRVEFLDAQIDRLDDLIIPLVTVRAPRLLDLYGVGPDTAAMLLVAAGDRPERLRSEAAWAHMCGVAPVPASSGKTRRHRLNRGGNREANHALWRIVITRMSAHPATRAYVERRAKEGLSKKEIIRCLKRYVAREVYPYLRG
jgi:hypothetical protein